jgi:ribosome-binding protein aMBF1 (putative translation factor)
MYIANFKMSQTENLIMADGKKRNGLDVLHERYIKGDAKRLKSIAEEKEKFNIAQQIYDLRQLAGLTQAQFAKKVGTTTSVISRLESADYQGYSLSTLKRVADALHQRVEIRFVPA